MMALRDSVIGTWSPWMGSSGYTLLDRSGNGSHGTLTNMAGTAWTANTIAGRSGGTLRFDGSNDFVNIPVNGWLNTNYTAGITYGGWVYPTASGQYQFLFGKAFGTGNNRDFGVWLAPSTNQYYAALRGTTLGPAGSLLSLSVSWAINTWNLILVSYSNGSLVTTVNGKTAHTATYTGDVEFSSSTQTLQIGAELTTTGPIFPLAGQVAEVYLWRRKLQPAEHAEIYRLKPGWLRQTRRRTYGFVAAGFKPYWSRQRTQLIGGGL